MVSFGVVSSDVALVSLLLFLVFSRETMRGLMSLVMSLENSVISWEQELDRSKTKVGSNTRVG